jgi:hypothetical protein
VKVFGKTKLGFVHFVCAYKKLDFVQLNNCLNKIRRCRVEVCVETKLGIVQLKFVHKQNEGYVQLEFVLK